MTCLPILQPGEKPTSIVVVDLENLTCSLHDHSIYSIHQDVFITTITAETDCQGVYYFTRRPAVSEHNPFHFALEKRGYKVILVDDDGAGDANLVDRAICKQLAGLAQSVQVVHMVSGDGGFIVALDQLVNEGKKIVVIAFDRSMSSLYRGRTGYRIISLDGFIDQAMIREERTTRMNGSSSSQAGQYLRVTLRGKLGALKCGRVIQALEPIVEAFDLYIEFEYPASE